MFVNYLKIGFRILYRQRSYSLLNIIGLAMGIAVFVFIFLYVQSELRFDKHWSGNENIYRITTDYRLNENSEEIALTPYLLAERIQKNFPEVEYSTKIFFSDPSDVNDMSSLFYNDEVYEVPDITIGDSNVFKIFDYVFVEGDRDLALTKPNTMVISTQVAKMIFGKEKALGKKLNTHIREYTVVGVFEKVCKPSHLNFDAIVSVNSLADKHIELLNSDWFWMSCYTYVKLHQNIDYHDFENSLNEYSTKEIKYFIEREDININGNTDYSLEKISDVHFNKTLLYDNPGNNDKIYLIVFAIIAGFILLTASINYINLATARSLKRAKEIGVLKVLGAERSQLSLQYISESLILTTLAFIIALSLVELLMPQFNQLIDKDLTLVGSLFSQGGILFGSFLVALIFILSIISGIFPAFVLSYLQPTNVLKGNKMIVGKGGTQQFSAGRLRKFLVTVQYVVTIGMIVSTIIIYQQMQFLKNHDLGFNPENVMVINLSQDTTFRSQASDFINELAKGEPIDQVALTGNAPGYTAGKRMFFTEDSSIIMTMNNFIVGKDYFKLLEIPLVEGRFFPDVTNNDSTVYYIINQAAADTLKTVNVIGHMLKSTYGKEGRIIGVVRNFHFSSFYTNIKPLVISYSEKGARYALLKIKKGEHNAAMQYINEIWDKYNHTQYLHYTYLDEKLTSLYRGDYKMLSLFIYFSIFVIFISSLGLYGLSSFLIEQRTKELGIRKVLGGTANNILMLLVKDYLKLVLLAGFIASPIVYILSGKWLNMFAISIEINVWYFVIGILLTMLIAFATVFIRVYKVIKERPSLALGYE